MAAHGQLDHLARREISAVGGQHLGHGFDLVRAPVQPVQRAQHRPGALGRLGGSGWRCRRGGLGARRSTGALQRRGEVTHVVRRGLCLRGLGLLRGGQPAGACFGGVERRDLDRFDHDRLLAKGNY